MKDFELSISPVETYKAPQLPKKGSDNSALLKKLPSRWQKSAKVLACVGIVGTLALSATGCLHFGGAGVPPIYIAHPTEQEVYGNITDQEVYNNIYTQTDARPHWGGGPVAMPNYVVYPTEQEILGQLDQFPDAIIYINGRRVEFGDYPIHINGYKMVPARELFEELGMDITFDGIDENIAMLITIGEREDIEIVAQAFTDDMIPFMIVNGWLVREDIPLIMHNDQIYVPLQFIARTVGAVMFWDEHIRMLEIFTN